MFTSTILHDALQLFLVSFGGVARPDFFDALRDAALLSWIPSLLLVRGGIHHRMAPPHARLRQPPTIDGVRAVAAILGCRRRTTARWRHVKRWRRTFVMRL